MTIALLRPIGPPYECRADASGICLATICCIDLQCRGSIFSASDFFREVP